VLNPEFFSPLFMTMEDKLQYQCAGFIQAEAEHFADELLEYRNETGGSDGGDTVHAASDSEDEAPPKAKKAKPRQFSKGFEGSLGDDLFAKSRARLESEHAFIHIINNFLRGVHAGIISARHSAVLLAYYGRLGNQFDHCVTTLVTVLREEGMFKQHGEVVVHVATEAIRQVSSSSTGRAT
jgi:cohesin complex subunit SA-1/2